MMKQLREHALFSLTELFDLLRKPVAKEFPGKHIDTYRDYNCLMTRICGEKKMNGRQSSTNLWNYDILLLYPTRSGQLNLTRTFSPDSGMHHN